MANPSESEASLEHSVDEPFDRLFTDFSLINSIILDTQGQPFGNEHAQEIDPWEFGQP